MLAHLTYLLPLLALAKAAPASNQKRDGTTSNVNFSENNGSPQHIASGMLYGIPDQPNQIPGNLLTGMGFNYLRAGGAQLPAPARGWIWGIDEYNVSLVGKRQSEELISCRTDSSQYSPTTTRPESMAQTSFS